MKDKRIKMKRKQISKVKRKCNLLVSKKIQRLRNEGIQQDIAIARAISYTKDTHPECRRYFKIKK